LQSNKKQLEQSTKKAISTATTQLGEAQTAQAKAEREATSLRESVKSLRDVWAKEVRGVREEVKKGEERWRSERTVAVSSRDYA
jgi:F0F1-type ATP synthase membrane subunit b/b'